LLTNLITIGETLLGLFDRKAKNDKEFFDSFIEPLFQDLILAHPDLVRAFEQTDEVAADDDLVQHLNALRVDLRPLRMKISAVVEALIDNKRTRSLPLGVPMFITAVALYLPAPDSDDERAYDARELLASPDAPGYRSNYGVVLRAVTQDDPNKNVRQEFRIARDKIDTNWSRLCVQYAKLKVRVAHRAI
jgi:hypothetical protein